MSVPAQPYPERIEALDVLDAKDELRRAVRSARDRRSARARSEAALGFAQVIGDLPAVRQSAVVAAYVSRPSEPDTVPLIERLARRGTRVLLPVLGAGLQRDWAWYTSTEQLEVRAPGRPPEPPGPTLGAEALGEAQAIIVPALAVDTSGARLGQGGGWYDRVLAHAHPDAVVVAMVFLEELYDAQVRPLPQQEHDQRVGFVATPGGVQRVGD